MKQAVLSFLLLIVFHSWSQTYNYKTYDWDQEPAKVDLTAEEKKEPAIIIEETRNMEYIMNAANEMERYLFVHRTVYVNEEKAVEDYNKVYLSISNPDNLITFKARTINPDRKIAEMFKGNLISTTEDGNKYMKLAVEGLQKGGILEYFYVQKVSVSYYGTEYVQSKVRKRKVDLSITSAKHLLFYAKTYNGLPEAKDTIINKKHVLSLIAENIPAIDSEPYSAVNAAMGRMEYKYKYNSDKEDNSVFNLTQAGIRYYKGFYTNNAESKKVKKIIADLNLKSLGEEEKIQTVENYIKTQINLITGGEAINLDEVLEKKYGTVDDICKVYLNFYKQLQVKCDLVICSERSDRKFDPDFDGWNFFDDFLIYFPTYKKFICPSKYVYRYGLTPYEYLDNYALFMKEVTLGDIKSATTAMKKIEVKDATDHYDNSLYTISFKTNFEPSIHITRALYGYAAQNIRPYYFYQTEAEQKNMIDQFAKQGEEKAKIMNLQVRNFDLTNNDATKEFIVDYDITSPSFMANTGETFLLNIGLLIGKQSEMYFEKERKLEIDVNNPHRYERTFNIQIPLGYKISNLEALNKNVQLTGSSSEDYAGFISSYEIKDNLLSLVVKEYYNFTTLPASNFEGFKKVINASADFCKITLIITK